MEGRQDRVAAIRETNRGELPAGSQSRCVEGRGSGRCVRGIDSFVGPGAQAIIGYRARFPRRDVGGTSAVIVAPPRFAVRTLRCELD